MNEEQGMFSNQSEDKLKAIMEALDKLLDENDLLKLSTETLESAQSLVSELLVKIMISIPSKREKRQTFNELLDDITWLMVWNGIKRPPPRFRGF